MCKCSNGEVYKLDERAINFLTEIGYEDYIISPDGSVRYEPVKGLETGLM